MGRVIEAFAQFFDGSGAPLQRGWLRFLESGSNNTDKTTFNDPTYQIPNANPLQLDGEGRCPNVFGTGNYRVISFENDPTDEDSPGTQIQMFDPVTAEAAADAGGGAGSFEIWDTSQEYGLGDIVTYNTEYYRSLITGNLGNNPAIEEYAWEKVDFVRYWNSTITYSQGDLVYQGYNLYLSKQSINQANDPEDSPAWWRPVATGYHNIYSKTGDYEILPTEFDSIFILADTVVADHQFDLPAMDATTDRFRVAIYNAADYDLTVSALGSTIWIDTSGDIVLSKGAFAEFIWSNDLSQWLVFGSIGPTLGAQDIGTATTQVVNVYTDFLHETIIPDDEKIYFGTDSDYFIEYRSADDILNFDNAWNISATGQLLPDPANPTKTIGSATAYVAGIYATNAYHSNIVMPDNGLITIGVGNALRISSLDTYSFVYSDNVPLYLGTTTAHELNFITSNTARGYISAGGELLIYSNIITTAGYFSGPTALYLGAAFHFKIEASGVHGVINASTGNLYMQTGSTTALYLDTSNNAFFSASVTVAASLVAAGTVQYGSLYDGSTFLTANLLEINQRCDGIPYSEQVTSGTVTLPDGINTSVATLNLGTVNAGSYALVDFYMGSVANSSIWAGKTPGSSANIVLGGYSNPITDDLFLSSFGRSSTPTLYVTTTGSLVLNLSVIPPLGGSSTTGAIIRVTWIKKT